MLQSYFKKKSQGKQSTNADVAEHVVVTSLTLGIIPSTGRITSLPPYAAMGPLQKFTSDPALP